MIFAARTVSAVSPVKAKSDRKAIELEKSVP